MIPVWGHTKHGCDRPHHSHREWYLRIAACAFRCFYCAQILTYEECTKDHLIPVFREGCECIGNLVPSCATCNSMKKERTVYEFLNARPAFVDTTGKFYSRITSLEPLADPTNDPLLREVRRLASLKGFPEPKIARVQQGASWAWRHPA